MEDRSRHLQPARTEFSCQDVFWKRNSAIFRRLEQGCWQPEDPGCQMQIGAGAILSGMDLTVCHPVELLDSSYERAGIYEASDSK